MGSNSSSPKAQAGIQLKAKRQLVPSWNVAGNVLPCYFVSISAIRQCWCVQDMSGGTVMVRIDTWKGGFVGGEKQYLEKKVSREDRMEVSQEFCFSCGVRRDVAPQMLLGNHSCSLFHFRMKFPTALPIIILDLLFFLFSYKFRSSHPTPNPNFRNLS